MTYKTYILSKEWNDLKVYLIEVRGLKCEDCGKPKKNASNLQLHHLTYKRLFNELPSDLLLLCPNCHMKEHGLIKDKVKKVKPLIKINTYKKPKPKKKKPASFYAKRNRMDKLNDKLRNGGFKSYKQYQQAKKAIAG